jgi:plastocyanin
MARVARVAGAAVLGGAVALGAVALVAADPAESHRGTISGSVLVINSAGSAVSPDGAWVYLEDQNAHRSRTPPGANGSADITQQNQMFSRASLVIARGTTVRFPNLDPLEHNVFSPANPPFDLGRYSFDRDGHTHTFDDAREYPIYCDIHPKMVSIIKVVESRPEWIQLADHGKYSFPDVPPGDYKVTVWLPYSDPVKGDAQVDANGTVTGPGTLHAHESGEPPPHTHRDGQPYKPY